MQSDFVKAFREAKNDPAAAKTTRGGYRIIIRLAGLRLIPAVFRELLTTFLIYLPVGDYHQIACDVVSRNWERLSKEDRKRVLAALLRMDNYGEISAVLAIDVPDEKKEREK